MYKNLAATVVAACCFSPVFSQAAAPAAPATEPLKIGFVYVAPLTDAGWVHQHDEGRKAVEDCLACIAPLYKDTCELSDDAFLSCQNACFPAAESIQAWPDQRTLAGHLSEAGWRDVEWMNIHGGIVALHRGFRA